MKKTNKINNSAMYEIVIQYGVKDKSLAPTKKSIRAWAMHVLKKEREQAEVTIRICDKTEITELNHTFRGKLKPTNVLSFPFPSMDDDSEEDILGDIAICAEIVNMEADTQGKTRDAHWAHMVIHGIYHLLGYDHIEDDEAEEMEGLEIIALSELGFKNPYIED